MSVSRSIVIHGHFYQPPREDPWVGEVEAEPTAAPFHDWNQRIERECYRAVIAARIPGPGGRIARIVNTLRGISYDAGPTLLAWMEREAPGTYRAFLEADRESHKRLGFGNAIAMPYHHVILPLCSRRDKVTEVRWGVRDFRRRFRREPEGMWLPETAVDHETLEVLATEGIRFTIVGQAQVATVPEGFLPARFRAAGGKSVAVFVYDGPLSHDVAFGALVQDGSLWGRRMLAASQTRRLVSLATDGETWGHHHKFGEMALASVLDQLGRHADLRVENFASFLAANPPLEDVDLVSPSSWSCPHGVERWRSDCGCRTAPHLDTQQQWRAPLRASLDWLAGKLHGLYAQEGASFFADAWAARDEHGAVAEEEGDRALPIRARELLEMERNALAMFTSCGWFFDDVGDVATVLVLSHAARAIELAGAPAAGLEPKLLEQLSTATSNDPAIGDAGRLYRSGLSGWSATPARAAAGFAAAQLTDPRADAQLPGYSLGPIPLYSPQASNPGQKPPDARHSSERAGESVAEPLVRDVGVEVEDRRTGRRHSVVLTAKRLSLAHVGISLAGQPVNLNTIPERHRVIIWRSLSRTVAEQWFSEQERGQLISGASDFIGVLSAALTRAVGEIAAGASAVAVQRLADLLDLWELLGPRSVPFDTQTQFYRALTCASGETRIQLSALAPRLGLLDQ